MNKNIHTPDFAPKPSDPCLCNSGNSFGECCGSLAEERPPPQGVILLRGWLSAEACDDLVSRLEKQPRGWLTVIDRKTGKEHLDPMRVTERVRLDGMSPEVIDLVRKAFADVAEPMMKCQIDWFISPNILRYSVGGHFRGHADSEVMDRETGLWRRLIDRDVSMLIYLNDGFQGGNITFTKFNFTHHPKKGDLLIFPSDQRYAHRAEPVTSGVRYSVVSWAALRDGIRVQPSKPERAISLRQED
jgi:predicted 2-oxoglutarate/Fe(II)-dependent dioxygenase YbiX